MVFEGGFTYDFIEKQLIYIKLQYINEVKKLELEKLTYENKKYNDIPFDVIKRGPLLILLIGLALACLSFAYELIAFFSNNSKIHVTNVTNVNLL